MFVCNCGHDVIPQLVYWERAGHYDNDPLRPLYIELVFTLGLKVTALYGACVSLIGSTQDIGWCEWKCDG